MKNFKEFALDLKQNDVAKFNMMYKHIMAQKNMDRIQKYVLDSIVETKELEDLQN